MSLAIIQKNSEARATAFRTKTVPVNIATDLATPMDTSFIQYKSGCVCSGICPACQAKQTIQPKHKVGIPSDKYEQQADRVADQVMRMPEPMLQRQETGEEEEQPASPDADILSPDYTSPLFPRPDHIGGFSLPSFSLLTPNPDRIDWLPIRSELTLRGAPFDDVMLNSITSLWLNNYSFLNRVIGLSDEDATFWTNKTIPLAVGAGVNRDYPTLTEQMDRELDTSTINIPVSDILLYLIGD